MTMTLADLPTNDEFDGWSYLLPGDEYYSGTFSVYSNAQHEDITPERIARVDAWHGVSPEGYGSVDFCCLVELTDGSWAACMAWADTSGWDCRSDVAWRWARTREDAISQGLDREARAKLGVSLPGEAATR